MLTKSFIEGTIDNICYRDEDTSWTVALLNVEEQKDKVKIVGIMPMVHVGEQIRAHGQWVVNKQYGREFKVESCIPLIPQTLRGIERYLSSGAVKGVGPKLARKIVARFGAKTLKVIETQPERLTWVNGVGEKKAKIISETFKRQHELREVMIFLAGHNIPMSYGLKIYQEYGANALNIVRENPYRLALEIQGIGFKTADRIANSVGISPSSLFRAEAGVLHVLGEASNEGHMFYPKDDLIQRTRALLQIEADRIERAIITNVQKERIVIENYHDQEAVFLKSLHIAEVYLARNFVKIMLTPGKRLDVKPEAAIRWIERNMGIGLSSQQREAILKILKAKILVITGGPGTGKTTILKGVVALFEKEGLRVVLCAPTGRAAKRLSEATGRKSTTVHRLLKVDPISGRFVHHENNRLQVDVLIVDETSMVDTVLLHHLLKAIPYESRVILVGDVDQLPSIGPGCVLRDIIESSKVEVVRLTEIFRQAKVSNIVLNAHRVNQGKFLSLDSGKKQDFLFIPQENPENVINIAKNIVSVFLPQTLGLDSIEDVQVLVPMHKGSCGTMRLNLELQRLLNPHSREFQIGTFKARIGDRVIQTRNNYQLEVFNGEVGWIQDVDLTDKKVLVKFDDHSIWYGAQDLEDLSLAYALSIHKSQGNEYPAVVILLLMEHFMLLQRNLLYTAITRGRDFVALIGSRRAIRMSINTQKVSQRFTGLKERLRGYLQ
jgi:exodeoxyribonuclease V alpha subunit